MGWGSKIKSVGSKYWKSPIAAPTKIIMDPTGKFGINDVYGGKSFKDIMGDTEMESASTLDPYQRALLGVGASSLAEKLPSAIDVMSKGMTSMDNAYDAAGSANVLAAMKANNLAAANRKRALNASKFQRTGLGRAAADTLADETLGRLNAEADRWDITNRQGALENAYARQQQWTQLLNSLYGASLGNTMENAAIKQPGLPEVSSIFANLAGGAKAAGIL